jgi:hypothetical protein
MNVEQTPIKNAAFLLNSYCDNAQFWMFSQGRVANSGLLAGSSNAISSKSGLL